MDSVAPLHYCTCTDSIKPSLLILFLCCVPCFQRIFVQNIFYCSLYYDTSDTCIVTGYSGGDGHFWTSNGMTLGSCVDRCLEESDCDIAVYQDRTCLLYTSERYEKKEDTDATMFTKKCPEAGKCYMFCSKLITNKG